jgi:hypothetical protein
MSVESQEASKKTPRTPLRKSTPFLSPAKSLGCDDDNAAVQGKREDHGGALSTVQTISLTAQALWPRPWALIAQPSVSSCLSACGGGGCPSLVSPPPVTLQYLPFSFLADICRPIGRRPSRNDFSPGLGILLGPSRRLCPALRSCHLACPVSWTIALPRQKHRYSPSKHRRRPWRPAGQAICGGLARLAYHPVLG